MGDRRALRRRRPLHGADGDPRAHEVGAGVRGAARPVVSCGCSGRSASRSTPRRGCWYREHIGGDRTPVVDTWWQTETGMILITPLPGVTTTKPGSATKPFPGVDAAVYDEQGNEVGPGGGGYLVLRRPWPAMLRGIHGDHERYVETYWSRFPGVYFAGDGARIDRGRRLLAPRARGRRDERLRPPDLDDRGRERARRPSRRWPRRPCAAAPTR